MLKRESENNPMAAEYLNGESIGAVNAENIGTKTE